MVIPRLSGGSDKTALDVVRGGEEDTQMLTPWRRRGRGKAVRAMSHRLFNNPVPR